MAARKPKATVVVLTWNGERYLERILDALSKQDYPAGYEVLVIDSGSTDATLEIIGRHPEVRLHTIPNSEFQHGRTRNLAATLAEGEYVVYLTHDAVPVGERWIANMVAPLELSSRVAGVVGRQHPRRDALPFVRYGVIGTFAALGAPYGMTLVERAPGAASGLDSFYSDVASATRASLLKGELPFREVDYAEDQWFGRDILERGFIKAYAGEATVEHSNDLTLGTIGPRVFDETLGLRRAGLLTGAPSLGASIKLVIRSVLREWISLARDRELSRRRRLFWMPQTPLVHIQAERYRRRALKADLHRSDEIKRSSLEHQLREAADS